MIIYRCCACTHDHATLSAAGMNEPTCARCGGSAFAQIHVADPEAPVLPLAPGEVLSGDGETPQVAALRPIEGKPAHLCSQRGCGAQASHRFTWPGHPEATACHMHALAATRVADAMGFFLEVPALHGAQ